MGVLVREELLVARDHFPESIVGNESLVGLDGKVLAEFVMF